MNRLIHISLILPILIIAFSLSSTFARSPAVNPEVDISIDGYEHRPVDENGEIVGMKIPATGQAENTLPIGLGGILLALLPLFLWVAISKSKRVQQDKEPHNVIELKSDKRDQDDQSKAA